MEFFHQGAMGTADFGHARPRLQAKDLIGLIFRHFAARRRAAAPRCVVRLCVISPAGKPAVKIGFQQRRAVAVETRAQARQFGQS